MFRRLFICITAIAVLQDVSALELPQNSIPPALTADSRQLRIDLRWKNVTAARYEIQRSAKPDGPFVGLTTPYPNRPFFTDFADQPGTVYYYRVRGQNDSGKQQRIDPLQWSPVVTGTAQPAHPDSLLNEVQEAGVHYFYDYGHPISGLARESFLRNPDLCATGATGMGLFNLIVGVERGFIARSDGAERTLKILDFFAHKADQFHGAFPHWLNGTTGKTIPFSRFDDGADLVETSFLMEGMLGAREYFSADTLAETQIRARVNELWRNVEWDWFARQGPAGSYLQWHWSPNFGWKQNLHISGFNEAQATYLLALASPTHPIKAQCYWDGWMTPQSGQRQKEPGVALELSHDCPSLFMAHYSYLGFDPHQIKYGSKTYFDHFKDVCQIQIDYAANKRGDADGYGTLWGLTASAGPDGYFAFAPGKWDNGTLAPTGALSSMPYAPQAAQSCLLELYQKHGKKLWSPFGFCDAFNMKRDWVCKDVVGIDVGPIAPMIENYRSGLCWKLFMNAKEIGPLMNLIARAPSEKAPALPTLNAFAGPARKLP